MQNAKLQTEFSFLETRGKKRTKFSSPFKIQNLKRKYPKFIYQNYFYKISGENLEIFFDFKIEPDFSFKPKITIKNVGLLRIDLNKLDNLVFHLGLIEMISYWKATCSPTIEIKAGYLNKKQIRWWQDLIMKGMGQFFFENKIPFQKPKFLIGRASTESDGEEENKVLFAFPKSAKGILVPVGGGKDSAVTLELLSDFSKKKAEIRCFSLNPTDAAKKMMKLAGCKKPVVAERKIDKLLLELNRKGFLNGHTPFSAYLAFLTTLVASLFGQKYIALSNEKSSNEGNVKYLGRTINHQWSKSFEFEEKFRKYSEKYLTEAVEYFSFLRPLYEIQIAEIFSRYPKYFPVFLSCNEAYKTASGTKKPAKKWCGKCSKCLFVFMVLYPFLKKKEILKIFGKNLFQDKKLLPLLQQLIGERGFKPFECVGTRSECRKALKLGLKKAKKTGEVPYLLTKIK